MKTPRQKYVNDPKYASLVNMMVYLIEEAEMTPSEVREAAILACIIYEEHHIRPSMIVPMNEDVVKVLKLRDKWVDNVAYVPDEFLGKQR